MSVYFSKGKKCSISLKEVKIKLFVLFIFVYKLLRQSLHSFIHHLQIIWWSWIVCLKLQLREIDTLGFTIFSVLIPSDELFR